VAATPSLACTPEQIYGAHIFESLKQNPEAQVFG
jgi:hypothetical protein